MIFPTTLNASMHRLENIENHEELLYRILEVFIDSYPVKDAYLIRYSQLGYLAEGIISIQPGKGLVHIRDLRDDIRSMTFFLDAVRERKAKYVSGIDYLKQTNTRYITPPSVDAFLIVPITVGTCVIGYIFCMEFTPNVQIDAALLEAMTHFGKQVGQLIEGSNIAGRGTSLSKRELEVMHRVAYGESTKEMAQSMAIQEVTVKQYVGSAIKKLGALNRTHAIGELYRRGILS